MNPRRERKKTKTAGIEIERAGTQRLLAGKDKELNDFEKE